MTKQEIDWRVNIYKQIVEDLTGLTVNNSYYKEIKDVFIFEFKGGYKGLCIDGLCLKQPECTRRVFEHTLGYAAERLLKKGE